MLSRLIPVNIFERLVTYHANDTKSFKKFLMNTDPHFLEEVGKQKALYMFKEAAIKVPHYKKFLDDNEINHEEIKTMEHFMRFIPHIDKKNYVKVAKSLKHLCVDGSLEKAGLLVRSSGFSGKACTWAKSRKEEHHAKNFATMGMNLLFDTDKYHTLLINGFALGSWVSGINLLRIADKETTIVNPGLIEDEVLELFKDLRGEFEQVLIAGNPYFLKDVIEKGNKKKINWKKYRVNLMTGGEAITEEWRDYMYNAVGASINSEKSGKIYSAFGASDIGITGINETKDSVKIRRLARRNPKLRKALFGDVKMLPMVFQYDPTQYYIHVNMKRELIFTTTSLHTLTPLIKYNIKDIGGTISHRRMKHILNQNGFKDDMNLPLPFIYIIGRSDGTVSFCGSLIYPENIKDAIYSNKKILSTTTEKFMLKVDFDKKQNEFLVVDFQLKKKVKVTNALKKFYTKAIEKSLLKTNPDFRQDYANIRKQHKNMAIVKVNLYTYDRYPYAKKIKVRHV